MNTGFKDIEGREIYVGDTLRFGDIGTWCDSKVWYQDGNFYIDDDGDKRLLADMIDYCLSTKIIKRTHEEE